MSAAVVAAKEDLAVDKAAARLVFLLDRPLIALAAAVLLP